MSLQADAFGKSDEVGHRLEMLCLRVDLEVRREFLEGLGPRGLERLEGQRLRREAAHERQSLRRAADAECAAVEAHRRGADAREDASAAAGIRPRRERGRRSGGH